MTENTTNVEGSNAVNPINPAEALRILSEKIKLEAVIIQRLREEIAKVIVGQTYM
ncbi:MAG: hypothetical protein RI883_2384, partial [Bacteroidota bacterium]